MTVPFTVNDIPLTSGHITLPNRGVWHATLALAAEEPPAVGASVTIVLGTLTLIGTVTRAGAHVSSSEVVVVGGRAGWRRVLKAKNYRADNNVRLLQVAADLATETGETVVLEPGAERALGYAWTRPAGAASIALDELEPRWWVDAAGVTHIGPRPAGSRVTAQFSVEAFSPAEEVLVITSPEDDLAAFPIGAELAGEGIGAFTIGALEARFSGTSLRVEARARDLPQAMRDVAGHIARASRFYGLYEYRVIEEIAGRLTLQVVTSADGIPDHLALDKAHGQAGAAEVCRPSSHVLVGFRGGKPSEPFVAHYLASTPLQASLDAATSITIGASLTPPLSLLLGGAAGAQPIALATGTAGAIGALATFAAAVAVYADAVAVVSPATVPAATALSTAASALASALPALVGAGPTGLTSVRTKSQ